MIFFLFVCLVFAIVIAKAVRDRRHSRYTLFAEAARELGFVAASEGPFYRRIWIHGNRDGLRFHAEPFRASQNGVKVERMGYRVVFPRPLDEPPREDSDPRLLLLRQLDKDFLDRQTDANLMFCARRSVPFAAEQLVEDARTVLTTSMSYMAMSLQGSEANPRPFQVPPPPLPESATSAVSEETAAAEELAEPTESAAPTESEASAESAAPTVSDTPSVAPDPSPDPGAAGETIAAREDWPAAGIPLSRLTTRSQAGAETSESTTAAPSSGNGGALPRLAAVARDLFAAGRNRYEIGRRFDEAHRGRAVSGRARLRGVAPYSHDRIFGRGPGLLATLEFETGHATANGEEENSPIPAVAVTLVAEIDSGDEGHADPASWKSRIGDELLVVGRLLRCDAFERALYLGEALCEGGEEG